MLVVLLEYVFPLYWRGTMLSVFTYYKLYCSTQQHVSGLLVANTVYYPLNNASSCTKCSVAISTR